ncbi:6,7-dimethyl-8-ribityllumazine synthase [Candidatus Woesearchaeota archaeon B3_Woes]|nr:MAG: 6,7-dimethyl-8-ribityllumazine synthase [Candidatus Woesearchaeota archaeon B3_Woes]
MNYKIGIVYTEFNSDITLPMFEIAKEHVSFLGGTVTKIAKVPGAFDMPLAVKTILKSDVDAIVTLGAVIEGNTDHDIIVAGNSARKITDLSLEYDKPVSLGISGPKMTHADAVKRISGYTKRSVEAAFKMIKEIEGLK